MASAERDVSFVIYDKQHSELEVTKKTVRAWESRQTPKIFKNPQIQEQHIIYPIINSHGDEQRTVKSIERLLLGSELNSLASHVANSGETSIPASPKRHVTGLLELIISDCEAKMFPSFMN